MDTLQKIVKVTQQQYDTLKNGGTVGSYTGLNSNYIYLVQDDDTTAGEVANLGYYDTITKNSDGSYTITRQTGYLTINTEDITRGSNETVNSAHAYVYAYSSKKVSDALYDWDAIIGISNNGFEIKFPSYLFEKDDGIQIEQDDSGKLTIKLNGVQEYSIK